MSGRKPWSGQLPMATPKSIPAKSIDSAGIGSPQHIYGEMFKMMAHVDMVHIPYRGGGPAVIDLLGGQVQVGFNGALESIEYIRSGKLRPLAVTTTARLDVLPNIPPVSDFLPGYEASGWQGVGAPKNTPAEIIDKLNKEIGVGLDDPKINARIAELRLRACRLACRLREACLRLHRKVGQSDQVGAHQARVRAAPAGVDIPQPPVPRNW